MTPLQIRAVLDGQIMDPKVRLDGLLAAVSAERLGMPPVHASGTELDRHLEELRSEVAKILQWEGRFFLCSDPSFEVEEWERRHITKRFPTDRAATQGSEKVRRIEISTGLSKNYRIPARACFLRDDRIIWHALGEQAAVLSALGEVLYLGKKRSLGLGKVRDWKVVPCESWAGFPVLRDGVPLRAVPVDYPGVQMHRIALDTLVFPHWDHTRKVPCAVA